MLTIGNVNIANQVIMAPMAGVTDKAFRIIAKSFGCGLVCTEMISDMGLIYGLDRTRRIADSSGETRPVSLQIFGSNPVTMGQAAHIAQNLGADIIDINMGCPTPKIVRNGEGAALMQDIPLSREIIRSVVNMAQVPVTVKMRTGWDDNHINCLELARIAEEEGAAAITLHARTRMQFYAGQADWDMIKKIKSQIAIPVIGNGDIRKAADARRMLDETGCDAVMIGRAAMGNPFLLRETVELLTNGRTIPASTPAEKVDVACRHLELAIEFKGEWVAVREMRKQLAWYIKGFPGAAQIRTHLNQATSKSELLAILGNM